MATAVAVVVALWTGARARSAADKALQDQLDAARDRQAEQHAELRERQAADHAELRERQTAEHEELRRRQGLEHEIDLLLAINEQAARLRAYGGAPQQREARIILRGLRQALPDKAEYQALVDALDPEALGCASPSCAR